MGVEGSSGGTKGVLGGRTKPSVIKDGFFFVHPLILMESR
jgi:hypothetical protein